MQDAAATQWGAFVAFAALGSFTPGPNNAIALATGVNFGWRRVLPHAVGVVVGFSTMLAAAAAGALGTVAALPGAAGMLKALGVVYLTWIAWQVAQAGSAAGRGLSRPPTVGQSALLQLVNVKGWMLSLSLASTWLADSGAFRARATASIAIFAALCAASVVAWAALGASLQRWLGAGARLRWFNRAMGAALAASALAMLA